MLKHQDHRFPGIERGDGLKIDFDKDPDKKRNQAHARDMKAKARGMSAAQMGEHWAVSERGLNERPRS
eukprot:1584993-Pyramimonas_sp.AAC.1